MEEKDAYIEGVVDTFKIITENIHKIMGMFDESVKETIEEKNDPGSFGEFFKKNFSEKIEGIINANEVQKKMGGTVRLLAGIAQFAFMKGWAVMLDKIMAQLDENIVESIKKILGEKDYHGKRWDISNFGDN